MNTFQVVTDQPLDVQVMLSGFALAVIASGCCAFLAHLGVRSDRKVMALRRELADRDRANADLQHRLTAAVAERDLAEARCATWQVRALTAETERDQGPGVTYDQETVG